MRRARQSYRDILSQLYEINKLTTVKLGLDNANQLHTALGRPLDAYRVVHVAGTNGKGSVCFKTAKALEAAGYRVGLFTSPHISCFRERATVNGQMISEAQVEQIMPHIWQTASDSNSLRPSFFECGALMAFTHFAEQQCDVVVLETGLGGRLDATNICSPIATCITTISLDHVSILGDTIEKIALEKAGIMKAGVPVCVGASCPHDVLQQRAEKVGAPYYQGENFDLHPSIRNFLDGETAGVGRHASASASADIANSHCDSSPFMDFDLENSELTALLLSVINESGSLHSNEIVSGSSNSSNSSESSSSTSTSSSSSGGSEGTGASPLITGVPVNAVLEGVAQRPPFRFQQVQPPAAPEVEVVFDVAHNEAGIGTLLQTLHRKYSPEQGIRFILGFSADKNVGSCLRSIFEFVRKNDDGSNSRLHFVQSRSPRALSVEALDDVLQKLALSGEVLYEKPGKGSVRALRSKMGHFYVTPGHEPGASESVSESDSGADATGLELAVREAVEQAREQGDILVVCGSMYIMQEVSQALGLPIPTDPISKT